MSDYQQWMNATYWQQRDSEIERLRAEVRRLRQIVVVLFIAGTVTWLAGLL